MVLIRLKFDTALLFLCFSILLTIDHSSLMPETNNSITYAYSLLHSTSHATLADLYGDFSQLNLFDHFAHSSD